LTRATRIPEPMVNSDIKELISDFLQRGASKTPLSVFAGDSITSVVYNFVEKQEKAAIQKYYTLLHQISIKLLTHHLTMAQIRTGFTGCHSAHSFARKGNYECRSN